MFSGRSAASHDMSQTIQKTGTLSVESLKTQVVWSRWQMSGKRLLKLILKGPVFGPVCRGKPGSVWNDVSLTDVHHLKSSYHGLNARNMPVWRIGLRCAYLSLMAKQVFPALNDYQRFILQVHYISCTECNQTGFM